MLKVWTLDDHVLEAVKSRGGEAEDSSELEGEYGSDKGEEDNGAPTLPTVVLGLETNTVVDICSRSCPP